MYQINKKLCVSCGLCADVCPVEAISQFGVYTINSEMCRSCGICLESCPSNAIEHTVHIPDSPDNNVFA